MSDPPSSRRDFFRFGARRVLGAIAQTVDDRLPQSDYIRPPGAITEPAFLAACTRCGKCTEVCPPHAIQPLPKSAGISAGTPRLRPNVQPCIMCVDAPCAAACPTGALIPLTDWVGIRIADVRFEEGLCIAVERIGHEAQLCGVCVKSCPVEGAITGDEFGRPTFDAKKCTGCGICVSACVTDPPSLSSVPLRFASAKS